MSLFAKQKELVKNQYVRVIDVLESLYRKSDSGWHEVGLFLKKSSIDTITTYSYSNDIIPDMIISNEVRIDHVYEDSYRLGSLKDALLAHIFNNCSQLDSEYIENKIIAENELVENFFNYAWLKSDLKKLEEFNILDFENILGSKKINISKVNIGSSVYEENRKYKELIFCIQNFSETFNKPIYTLVKFLKQKKFYNYCDVYIRVGEGEFLMLNKINSEKSISFVLNFLDDKKFDKEIPFECDYYETIHILIDENDLYFFEPLQDMNVDVKMGHSIYEGFKFGDINQRKLELGFNYYHQETEKIFKENWKKLKIDTSEEESLTQQVTSETFSNLLNQHPALDTDHPNHAPELKLAFELWEEIYVKGRYVESHSKSVEQLLCERGYEARSPKTYDLTNLAKRIIAITNKK